MQIVRSGDNSKTQLLSQIGNVPVQSARFPELSKTFHLEQVLASIPLQIASQEMLLGFCPASSGSSAVLQCGAQLPIATFNCVWSAVSVFYQGVCLSVTLLIADLWQCCVGCMRSGVICCTLSMVVYLCRMCRQCIFTRCSGRASVYAYSLPRCSTSQYRKTLISLSVSMWNDLADPVFDGVGLACFKSSAKVFLLA